MFTRISTSESDIFCHLQPDVDNIVKLLKTNVFILEKFLDTAFRGPIRFRQKVLMVFFWTPLELFSLEREGRPVAGRPFRLFLSLRSTPLSGPFLLERDLRLSQRARRVVGLALNPCREASLRSKPLNRLFSTENADAPDVAGSPRGRARPWFLSVRSTPLSGRFLLECVLRLSQRARRVVGLALDPVAKLRFAPNR